MIYAVLDHLNITVKGMPVVQLVNFNKDKEEFPVRFFAYSPSITHGFSIDDEEGYFDLFLSIAVPSAVPARDIVQQWKRNRN